ncbi:hypothetical protein [Paenibacillus albus]|uniref:Uncharacterized protein n=1 Tax=Paenibacillus albus TaxID=2495582 RepID=A0A3Q8X8B7_9BACL|nr:hypothetical protein [Paenibacillus albus]AZN42743.1 hypothetical protein EJC50_25935 [Paenibacillus albus]
MVEKEAQAPAVTSEEAASELRQAKQSEASEPNRSVEAQIGPDGAAPHWREFYQAIRDAVEAMRSDQ